VSAFISSSPLLFSSFFRGSVVVGVVGVVAWSASCALSFSLLPSFSLSFFFLLSSPRNDRRYSISRRGEPYWNEAGLTERVPPPFLLFFSPFFSFFFFLFSPCRRRRKDVHSRGENARTVTRSLRLETSVFPVWPLPLPPPSPFFFFFSRMGIEEKVRGRVSYRAGPLDPFPFLFLPPLSLSFFSLFPPERGRKWR